jgi:hypothetical protein
VGIYTTAEKTQENAPRYRTSLRLTFQYEHEHIELIDKKQFNIIALPSIGIKPEAGKNSGFWIELCDSDNRVIYYRVLHNPIPYTVESYSPDQKIHIRQVESIKGKFEILIPDIPEATKILLYSSPLNLERSLEPAREIASFTLQQKSNSERGMQEQL